MKGDSAGADFFSWAVMGGSTCPALGFPWVIQVSAQSLHLDVTFDLRVDLIDRRRQIQ